MKRATLIIGFLSLVLSASAQAEDYTYRTNNNAIIIHRYTGPGGDVTIPNQINGYPVTRIEDWGFAVCSNVTGVTIPDSITDVAVVTYTPRSVPFWLCWKLTAIRVDANNSVYSSADGVLFDKNKTTLTRCPNGKTGDYTIPNSVTTVKDRAFQGCFKLSSITIPSSVTNIGEEAFDGCSKLNAIKVDPSNSVYSSIDGVLLNKNQTTLVKCPGGKTGNYTTPNSVTNIASKAFACSFGLTNITIPNSVTTIEHEAFYYCDNLRTVIIPNSVMTIGFIAFGFCTNLTSVTIGDSVTSIGLRAFWGCSKLTSITIPNKVTTIEDGAFMDCTSLRTVIISSSVTNIKSGIDDRTNTLNGEAVFSDCNNLTAISVDASNSGYSSVDGVLFNKNRTTLIEYPKGRAGHYTIPDGVISIGSEAFRHCTKLTSITIPNSVTTIKHMVFYECIRLGDVTVGNSVTNIGVGVFDGCTSLTRINFKGNPPHVSGTRTLGRAEKATIYYLRGTTGWGPTYGGRPTAVWNP